MTRRIALQIVGVLLAATPQRLAGQTKGVTTKILLSPQKSEVVEIDFGSGAGRVKTIHLVEGAVAVDVSVDELMAALAAKP